MTVIPFDPSSIGDALRAQMSNEQRANYDWQEPYMPLVRAIIAQYLLVTACVRADRFEATDLIVRPGVRRICVRMRRPEYNCYSNEFTIRLHAPGGQATELKRVVGGFGDWLFVGHAAFGPRLRLACWLLVDLKVFRWHWRRNRQQLRWVKKNNRDGSDFVAFDVASFPASPPILVARSDP